MIKSHISPMAFGRLPFASFADFSIINFVIKYFPLQFHNGLGSFQSQGDFETSQFKLPFFQVSQYTVICYWGNVSLSPSEHHSILMITSVIMSLFYPWFSMIIEDLLMCLFGIPLSLSGDINSANCFLFTFSIRYLSVTNSQHYVGYLRDC